MKYFGWILFFFLIVYILPLGSRPLVSPEFTFAETAREMVVSGNYVTPQLLGETVEKYQAPAFYPAAKSIQLFGNNGFAVRFPGALAAGLTALFIWILISLTLRDEKLAALSAVIYLCTSAVYLSGTFANSGILFAMLTTGSCGCIFTALQENKFNRRKMLNLILCGVFMGLGFAVGGFEAALIPFISGITYMMWDRKWRQLPLILIVPLIFAGAVALPWLLAMHKVEPGFLCRLVRDTFASIGSGKTEVSRYWHLGVFVFGAFPAILLIPAVVAMLLAFRSE